MILRVERFPSFFSLLDLDVYMYIRCSNVLPQVIRHKDSGYICLFDEF